MGTDLETAAVCEDLVAAPVFLVSCYDGAASSLPSFFVCAYAHTHARTHTCALTHSVLEALVSEARSAELAAAHLRNGPQHSRKLPQHQGLTPIRGLMCSLKTRVLISSGSSIKQELYLSAAFCILIGGGLSLYRDVTAAW